MIASRHVACENMPAGPRQLGVKPENGNSVGVPDSNRIAITRLDCAQDRQQLVSFIRRADPAQFLNSLG
jgi:hypothetical protein